MSSTYGPGDSFLLKKFGTDYKTNDLLYFRYPEIDSAIPKTSCIQRLIGLPGDTIQIKDKIVFLNNYPVKDTSTVKYNYYIKSKITLDSNFTLRYKLTEGGPISPELDYSYSLTRAESENLKKDSVIIRVELKTEQKGSYDETVYPYTPSVNWNMDNFGKLYIPKNNDTIQLDPFNIILYSAIITIYENNHLEVKRDSVFINHKPAKKYIVKNNYYFVMGDNRDNANDSRVFGLLPENYIRGKIIKLLKKR